MTWGGESGELLAEGAAEEMGIPEEELEEATAAAAAAAAAAATDEALGGGGGGFSEQHEQRPGNGETPFSPGKSG